MSMSFEGNLRYVTRTSDPRKELDHLSQHYVPKRVLCRRLSDKVLVFIFAVCVLFCFAENFCFADVFTPQRGIAQSKCPSPLSPLILQRIQVFTVLELVVVGRQQN